MSSQTPDPHSDSPTADSATAPYNSAAVGRARDALEAIPEKIGHYRILERIGGGGMGEVFVAEQTAPIKRRVALKIIKAGMDTKQVVARFEAERQALAMMDHPNIAKVFDAGTTDTGRPYFVMELVRGVPITQFCDDNRLTTRQRIELLVPVCHAVQHAHQKGVIHRDIKPTNVLVTLHDGVPVPKVIDFGIAKATSQPLTDKTVYTEFRQMIGTPAYMSPEQAEMSGLDIDTRSDVYGLGVLMYELLTGTTPFDTTRLVKAGLMEIQRIIKEEEPPRPSLRISSLGQTLPSVAAQRGIEPARLGKLVAGELDWIVMRAMEKDRKRRYETASDLAADLRRHLDGEPVVAAPPGAVYRARKFLCKHRAPVTAGVALAGMLGAGIVGTSWQWRRAERNAVLAIAQRNAATTQQVEAEKQRDVAETEAYIANLALGQAAIQADRWPEARQRFESCAVSKRGWEWKYLRMTADTIRYTIAADADGAEVSPDGIVIRTVSWDTSTLRLWKASDGSPIGRPIPLNGMGQGLVWSPDGSRITTTSALKTAQGQAIQQWDSRTAEPVGETIVVQFAIRRIGYSPDGRYLAVNDSEQSLHVWNATTGQAIDPQTIDMSWANTLTAVNTGKRYRVTSKDGKWRVDSSTGRHCLIVYDVNNRPVGVAYGITRPFLTDAELFPNSSLLLIGNGRKLELGVSPISERFMVADAAQIDAPRCRFEADSPQELELQLIGLSGNTTSNVPARATSPDGKRIVEANHEVGVRFLDGTTKREIVAVDTAAAVTQLRFTPDGTRLLLAFADGTLEIWDTRDYAERQKDRDARFADIPAAREYVRKLLATDTPADKLKDAVRNDRGISPLRKLVALEQLAIAMDDLDRKADDQFRQIKEKVWIREDAVQMATALPDHRIAQKVSKLASDWDENYYANRLWEALQSPTVPPDIAKIQVHCMRWVARDPKNHYSHFAAALAHYRAGDLVKARQSIDRTISVAREEGWSESTYRALLSVSAMIYARAGNVSQAKSEFAAARMAERSPPDERDRERALFAEAAALIDPASTQPATRPTAVPSEHR